MYALIKVEFLIISPHRKKFSTNLPTFNDENTVNGSRKPPELDFWYEFTLT